MVKFFFIYIYRKKNKVPIHKETENADQNRLVRGKTNVFYNDHNDDNVNHNNRGTLNIAKTEKINPNRRKARKDKLEFKQFLN